MDCPEKYHEPWPRCFRLTAHVSHFLHGQEFSRLLMAPGNPKQMSGEAVGHWVKCEGNRKGKNHSSFIFKIDSNREVAVIYKLEEG